VIRAIFALYRDGYGLTAIAKTLNGELKYADHSARYFGGQTPPSPWKGTGSWAPSSVHGVLHRERYTGKVPFGKHRNVYRAGEKQRERQDEYLLADAPHLRIVPAKLWDEVQARLKAVAATYVRNNKGNLWGRPETGRASRYLLSGLMRCQCCGGGMVVTGVPIGSPGRRTRLDRRYVCHYHHKRGRIICANGHKPRVDDIDEMLLDAIEHQVLSSAVIAEAVRQAAELVRERLRQEPNRPKAIEAELRKLRRELDRFSDLIAGGQAAAYGAGRDRAARRPRSGAKGRAGATPGTTTGHRPQRPADAARLGGAAGAVPGATAGQRAPRAPGLA